MTRLLPLLLVACAATKPVVATSRPNGATVIADADKRWTAYMAAQTAAVQVALARANAATPGTAPEHVAHQKVANDSTSLWFPDEERFEVRYTYSITIIESWQLPERGCGKYDRYPALPPGPDPQLQPSPIPCPPPMPVYKSREYTATMGLVVEYDADGKFLAEHPSLPVAAPPKPAAPKR